MSAAALRWTAEDEAMLEAEGLGDALGAAGGFELSDEEDDDGGAPSEEQVARDARSAAKTAMLQNSVLSDIEGFRRPRWRLVAELLPGETADDIPEEAVMRGASLFRAGVRAVLGGVVLRRAALAKRRAALKADRTDLLDLFGFFAVPLRAWLAKAVKLPVMSILSEPTMNLDVRAASSGGGGLAGPLMRCAVGLRLVKTDTLEQRMLKLKVRVKGVLDELEKQSVRHKTLPGNVVDFLHKLSCDGACLPPAFLFEAERSELEFSELGATRHMGAAPLRPLLLAGVEEELLAKQQQLRVGDRVMCKYKGSAAELGATVQAVHGGGAHFDVEYHHSCEVERRLEAASVRAVAFGRRHLLLLNLLVVRALLRMVIEPWNFGMGRRPKRPRVRQNLRVLASVLLAIVRLALPGLPPGCEPPPGWKSKLEAVDEAPAEDEEEDEGEDEGGDARAEKGDGEDDAAGGDSASADGSQNGDGGASSTGKEGGGGSGGGKDGETSTAADDDDGNADGAAAAAPTASPLPSLFSATEREIACELLPQTHFDEARHLLGWLPDMKDRLLRWVGTVTGAVEDTDRQQREREAEEQQRGSEKGDHASPADVANAAAAKASAVAKAAAAKAKAGASVGAAAGLLTGAAAAVVGLA